MNKRPASILSGVVITLALFVFGCFFSASAGAQSPRIVHEVIKSSKPTQSMGRDLWFTMAENYQWSSNGKYYDLYVTSPAATTVNITIGKATQSKFPIKANQVISFRVPLAWELKESGTVEQKAVHVWSETADLSAYLLSRNPYTSDGMFIIPSVGWGTEYVVAAYHSHWAGTAGGDGDLPSEFCIVANADNTVVTVNPKADIRDGQDADKLLYRKNVPFTVTLNRGEAVQYQAMRNPSQVEGYDFTGTVVTSTKPIGIVGGVMCANIPVEVPYCDHICDMIPPVRTWANTYYTAPFINRKGGDTFLIIASADNQTITRVSKTGTRVHAILNKYETFYRHDIEEASRWESDKPFLIAQYCNSTEWPGDGVNNNGIGDPAMTIVNAVEQFSPKVIFQTPTIATGASAFTNYVNILVHKNAVNSTTFDGVRISGKFQAIVIDDKYLAYRGSNIPPGAHTVVSDSGVGVYIYGYGSYDSYAWTGAFGTRTFLSPDTIAPDVNIQTQCFTSRINVTDKGTESAKLNAIDLDTVSNFEFNIDPNWQAGAGKEASFYDIEVIDQSKEAYVSVVVYDGAGNTATINSRYTPQIATISPELTDFGIVNGTIPVTKKVTITNIGRTDFNITTLKLKLGNKGFALVNPDKSPLRPGEARDITVSFLSIVPETVGDTIIFGDDCYTQQAVVIGNGGAADYTVYGVDLGPILVGKDVLSDVGIPLASTDKGVYVKNGPGGTVQIDDVTLSNTTDFELIYPQKADLPILLTQPNEEREIIVKYIALAEPGAKTDVIFSSKTPANKTAVVNGKARKPGAEIFASQTFNLACTKEGEFQPYTFTIKSNGTAPMLINSIRVSGDVTYFDQVKITDQGTEIVLPEPLPVGREWNVTTSFLPKPNMSGTYKLLIEVLDQADQVLQSGSVEATAVTEYREYEYVGSTDFGTLNYGDAPVTRTIKIRNTTSLPVEVERPIPETGDPGSNPASFTLISPVAADWPITLGPSEERDITVQFDPSVSTAATQDVNYVAASDACVSKMVTFNAAVRLGGFTVQGFNAPQIFSCESVTNPVVATAAKSLKTAQLTWNLIGPDATRFTTTMTSPQVMTTGQQLAIPVTFTPVPSTAARNYSAMMTFTFTNDVGDTFRDTVIIGGMSGGIVATAASNFATSKAEAGDVVRLPITLDIAKNVNTLDLTNANLRKAHLVYTYNTDLLSFPDDDVVSRVTVAPQGWAVDPMSKVTPTGLDLWLTGPTSLTENNTSLGEIEFFVRLPERDETDQVNLETFELFGANNEAYGDCLATSATGTSLDLVYRCGDAVYQQIMRDGKLSTIDPMSPNPVTTEKVVTFRYGTRVESAISLDIIDPLGNLVDRVVDNLLHKVGAYEIRYDVSKLESGSYIYRFTGYGGTSSHRFVVAK
jgi:hypothetical protein